MEREKIKRIEFSKREFRLLGGIWHVPAGPNNDIRLLDGSEDDRIVKITNRHGFSIWVDWNLEVELIEKEKK